MAIPALPQNLKDLQPLCVPAGWTINWNTLYETSDAANGDFGGSSLFRAVHASRRFTIDVEYRPEFDPNGQFQLSVAYEPWPRTESGKRAVQGAAAVQPAVETVHEFRTRDYRELVAELEGWLGRCAAWVREGH